MAGVKRPTAPYLGIGVDSDEETVMRASAWKIKAHGVAIGVAMAVAFALALSDLALGLALGLSIAIPLGVEPCGDAPGGDRDAG